MLRVKVPILEVTAENVNSNYIITEQACKEAVENWKNLKTLPVILGKIPIGKIINLELSEDSRTVIADIELYLNFTSTCGILQDLETKEGKVVLNLKIGGVAVQLEESTIQELIKDLNKNQEG